jgi:LacI family transcriptional regulator, repressor for deo operon, udp, cdd, tsx, nupC, and nupG
MSISQIDIASKLGVSQRAVSFALNGKPGVSPIMRKQIVELARNMGYRPNAAARAMVSQQTRNIGVVIHSLGNGDGGGGHAYDTVSGINSIIEPAGYTTCLVQMTDVESGDEGMARVFREQALDGMIFHAGVLNHVRERLGQWVERTIWCDAGVEDETNCIWRDEVEAGRLAGQAVVEAGFRDVLYFHSPPGEPRAYRHRERREAGVRSAVEAAGGVVRCHAERDEEMLHVDRWLHLLRPETAVVASEYRHAEGLLFFAAAAGLCAGRDFALVCCDDRDFYQRRLPHLSRSGFDRFAMGQRAARMLLQRLEAVNEPAPSQIVHPTWIAGHSDSPRIRPTLVPITELRTPPAGAGGNS